MRTWKIVRIYKVTAERKADALTMFRAAEAKGIAGEYLAVEFAVEEKPEGFWRQLVRQLVG